jgi:hypothetical protein
MRASPFFEGVAHIPFTWQNMTVFGPTFYYDVGMLSAQFLTPLAGLRPLLPSRRLHPLRITPWHGIVDVMAFEYRDCDIGPYNEVSIAIPVTLDRPSPPLTGLVWPIPVEPDGYIVHLPVTTEIARGLGVETAAYPKFLAGIAFQEEGGWLSARLSEQGQHILTLAVRQGPLAYSPRYRIHPINARGRRLLRPMVIFDEREEFVSRNPGDVRLELGDHRISQQLRDLHLGRALECQYTPRMQTILTPVLESFDV